MPGATVEDLGAFSAFTSCDPGAAAATPAAETIVAAEQLLAVRGELTAEIAEQGVHEDTARCSARLLARDPALVNALLAAGDTLTPESQQQLASTFAASESACAPIRPPACTPERAPDRSTNV